MTNPYYLRLPFTLLTDESKRGMYVLLLLIIIHTSIKATAVKAVKDGNDYLLPLIIIYPLRHTFKAQARWYVTSVIGVNIDY